MGKKVISEEEKEERAQLKAAKIAEKKAKNAAESEEKKKLREEKALKMAKEKKEWMTQKRITDPNNGGEELRGINGAFLRIQKHRTLGNFRKLVVDNWTEKANEVFETNYSMISNIPNSKKPDMSKVLEKLNEDANEDATNEDTNQIEKDIEISKAETLKIKKDIEISKAEKLKIKKEKKRK